MFNIFSVDFDKIEYIHLENLVDNETEESQYLDVKEEFPNNKKIAKVIASFSNSDGGWLIIGIKERNEKIIEITPIPVNLTTPNTKHFEDIINSNISPNPYYKVKSVLVPKDPNKEVIVAQVFSGFETPYLTKDGRIYRRIHTSSEPIKDHYILQKIYEKGYKFIENLLNFSNYNWSWSKGGDESLAFCTGTIIPQPFPSSSEIQKIDESLKEKILDSLDKFLFTFTKDFYLTFQNPEMTKKIRFGFDGIFIDLSFASSIQNVWIDDLISVHFWENGMMNYCFSVPKQMNSPIEEEIQKIVDKENINVIDGNHLIFKTITILAIYFKMLEIRQMSPRELFTRFRFENIWNSFIYLNDQKFNDNYIKYGISPFRVNSIEIPYSDIRIFGGKLSKFFNVIDMSQAQEEQDSISISPETLILGNILGNLGLEFKNIIRFLQNLKYKTKISF